MKHLRTSCLNILSSVSHVWFFLRKLITNLIMLRFFQLCGWRTHSKMFIYLWFIQPCKNREESHKWESSTRDQSSLCGSSVQASSLQVTNEWTIWFSASGHGKWHKTPKCYCFHCVSHRLNLNLYLIWKVKKNKVPHLQVCFESILQNLVCSWSWNVIDLHLFSSNSRLLCVVSKRTAWKFLWEKRVMTM